MPGPTTRQTLALVALPLAATLGSATTLAAHAPTRQRTFSGPVEYMQHGPIQAHITVKKDRIIGVTISNTPVDARSIFLQDQAIPVLKQETLRAQSARIALVSGATETSDGYIASLQAAIRKARAA